MPPTFAYIIFLMAYLAMMTVGLGACVLLAFVPSKRQLALRLALAIVFSLPGILAFQFVIGIPLSVLLAMVLGFYSVFHPPDWVQLVVGVPTILLMFSSLVTASLLGCYAGGSIGWQTAAGMPLRSAIAHQRVIRYSVSRLQSRRAKHMLERARHE